MTYIDDSKGTNVGATLAAVAGMPGPLVLIAGGDGKNQDFTPLAGAFRGKVRHAVLIGRDAARIAAALAGVCTLETCATLAAGGRGGRTRGAPGRHRAALARVREPRHVPRLRASRRRVRAGRAGAGGMSSSLQSALPGLARAHGRGASVHLTP